MLAAGRQLEHSVTGQIGNRYDAVLIVTPEPNIVQPRTTAPYQFPRLTATIGEIRATKK